MALQEVLHEIDELQIEINSFGKLDADVLKRINYKFRLDWNYYSNAIEGNSLTREETRSVMINNVTIEGRPIKDILEIKGHDQVISDILKIGKGELRLSEKRIKEIHKAIIHEDDLEQQKKIGVWKTIDNHLINYKGEKFDFLPHGEVPEEMHKLIDWLNQQIDWHNKRDKRALHPALIAFQFHLRYVSIHPFYDGNGRTARILANLILISFGFPPVIIKLTDKNVYNQYLADIQGYGGNEDLYLEFMGRLLVSSQKLVLNAIHGEDIEDTDDLDKKLLLLERELDAIDSNNEVKERFGSEAFLKMYDSWISDLLRKAIPIMQKFNKFFTGTNHYVSLTNFSGVGFVNQPAEELIIKLRYEFLLRPDRISAPSELAVSLNYGTFKKGGLHTFGCNYRCVIIFDEIKYHVRVEDFTEDGSRGKYYEFPERLLHQPLKSGEIDTLVKKLSETVYKHIDFNTKKNGIR